MDLDPKAVTCDELFGIIHPATREWKDGETPMLSAQSVGCEMEWEDFSLGLFPGVGGRRNMFCGSTNPMCPPANGCVWRGKT